MSGTLLLINRNNNKQSEFQNTIARLRSQIKCLFAQYFPTIVFHNPNPDSCLIEFRKNKTNKFYSDPASGSWLAYEGTVFVLRETRALSAEELFTRYLKKGKAFVHDLDGPFVIKLYDYNQDQYLVINDFIKNKTNYYTITDDAILFSPFLLPATIIRSPEPDLEAINEFMWRYYILSEKTVLKDVARLAPASIYQIKNNKVIHETYWDWPHHYTTASFQEAVQRMVAGMQETAHLIYNTFGKPCIDFTMGQDSRQVVAAFTNQNLPITTFTYGKPDFYEVIHVAEMAKRHNLENHNIRLEQDYFENIGEMFSRAIILGSCEQPGQLLGRILYMKSKYNRFGNVSLNGSDGHFYKNGLWDELYTFNLYREPKTFNIDTFLHYRALSNNYNDSIFTSDLLTVKNNSKRYFTQLIHKSIENHLDAPVSIQVDKFDLHHWLNFGIAGNNTINFIIDHISPLILRRNLEWAIQLPVQWKFNLSKLQRAVVYNLDHSLAAEKTDFGGVNMLPKTGLATIPFFCRYFYFQSGRFRRKIKSKLGLKVTTHLQEAWDYLPVYRHLLASDLISETLDMAHLQESGIIDETKWAAFRKEYSAENILSLKDLEYILKLASIEHFFQLADENSI